MKKNKLFIELGNVIKLSVLVTSLTVFLVSIYGLTRVYNNPFPLSMNFGTLTGDLGCFPLDYGAYPPQSHCHAITYRHSEFG